MKVKNFIKVFKYSILVLIGLGLCIGIIGFVFEVNAKRVALEEFPPAGELVAVSEQVTLHINSQGEKKPIVVIESGVGSWSLAWDKVQKEVSQFATVVTYDRAGLGWSGAGESDRTGDQVNSELHDLLTRTGHKGPYILVGHSLGGLYSQLFANRYPEEVAGMILVDTRPPNFEEEFPALKEDYSNQAKQMKMYKFISSFGVVRLLAGGAIHPSYSETNRELNIAIGFQGKSFDAIRSEILAMEAIDQEVLAIKDQKDVPTTVITHGISEDFSALGLTKEENEQIEASWQSYQKKLANSFEVNELIVAEESKHNIMLEQPEIIIEAIKQMIANNIN